MAASVTARLPGLAVALVAGAALAFALTAEYQFGLVPCALCLLARWPYRVALAFGLLAAILPHRAWLWAALACGLALCAIALTHIGVEQGLWPSPLPECAASRAVIGARSVAEMLSNMPLTPSKPCDEPTYLLPRVSFVTLSAAYALCATVALAIYLRRHRSLP